MKTRVLHIIGIALIMIGILLLGFGVGSYVNWAHETRIEKKPSALEWRV